MSARSLNLSLDDFAWEALTAESRRMEAPVEEIARFAVLYYLADIDSGRVARRPPAKLLTARRRRPAGTPHSCA